MLPLAVFAVTLCLSGVLSAPTLDSSLDELWDQWKSWHSKSYHEVGGAWLLLLRLRTFTAASLCDQEDV